ncbi:MAG: enoyl-CoA hydratase/isomerase family protein [Dehalococcoidia bacterium]|nr:enoyl-CoA hydratase/isomerase family protein [Dehalococcoidia bacterium]HRC63452.1 enoyl-CoA hydratase-related protein [Dehalococcoidia bacterium]
MAPPKLVDYLLYEVEESGICWIRLNRPERMNAVIGTAEENSTVVKVGEYMRAADDDPRVRVIVLTGVGRAFCAGVDVRGDIPAEVIGERLVGNRNAEDTAEGTRQNFIHGLTKVMRDISQVRKPTIAMINGVAAGIGMDMSLHCDIRIGCEATRFITYHQVGQIIENGGSYYLPKIAGLGRALEFAYTGHLDAERAYQWGILNHLVPSDQLEQTTRELCERIIGVPPLVQWISKRIMRQALDSSLETTMVLTSNAASILGGSEDGREAREALRERRTPSFRGR